MANLVKHTPERECAFTLNFFQEETDSVVPKCQVIYCVGFKTCIIGRSKVWQASEQSHEQCTSISVIENKKRR